jgi:small subunit ribosomal protein S20
MANTKSAIKAARKSLRNAARNQTVKTRLKTLAKSVQKAAAAGNAEVARAAAIAYSSALDKAVKSHVVHRNTASHHKSRVAKHIFAAKK